MKHRRLFFLSAIAVVLVLLYLTNGTRHTASAQASALVADGWHDAFYSSLTADGQASSSHPKPAAKLTSYVTQTIISYQPATPNAGVPFTIVVQVVPQCPIKCQHPAGTVDVAANGHGLGIQSLDAAGFAYYPYTARPTCITFQAEYSGNPNVTPKYLPSSNTRTTCFVFP